MTIHLRPYQATDTAKIYQAWADGYRNVLFRADTGYGKTAVLAKIVSDHQGASAIIAHRHELVSQISLMLAKYGVRHNIIASKATCRMIAELHVKKLGRCYYDPGARCAVASVQTIVKRKDLGVWASQVTLWICDEGHHLVLDNSWHTATEMFTHPQCKGLLPTATPKRADGKGLGRHADGVADIMIEGPPMRWLIDEGYLTDYKIAVVDSHVEQFLGKVGDSGDWSNATLGGITDKTPIVGDVAKSYRAEAHGFTGIVFSSDVVTAGKMLQAYRTAGYRAEMITGETDPNVRRNTIEALEFGRLDLIVVVDIVSEGFDLPAVRVGIMGRATASYIIYAQQWGRLLRPIYAPGYDLNTREGRLAAIAASNKPWALLIDHVSNFFRHNGPPDKVRYWTLDRTGPRSNGPSDAIPMRVCLNKGPPVCGKPYERIYSECPHCGHPAPVPADRSGPEMVDGVVSMLDPAILAKIRGDVEAVNMSIDDYRHKLAASGLPARFIMHNVKAHDAKQKAQAALREVMAWWGGQQRAAGFKDTEMQRRFFFLFGIDVYSAQGLGAAEAENLLTRIINDGSVNL